jgi:C1A family cysteine protease
MAKKKKEFERNWKIVKKHNATEAGYSLDINEFSDLTQDDFNKILMFKPQSAKRKSNKSSGSKSTNNTTTTAFDWRQYGAVSSVKNQGSCGSCYAFASAGALEGLYKIKGGSLVDISA